MRWHELTEVPNERQLGRLVALSKLMQDVLGAEGEDSIGLKTQVSCSWDLLADMQTLKVQFLLYCDSSEVRELLNSMGATEVTEELPNNEDYTHKYFHKFTLGNTEFRIFDNQKGE